MCVIMVLIWAFVPGELVMKNGKLLAYQGEYKVEEGYVKFTSLTGASLQLPVAAVDFEKTKARDAKLEVKAPSQETVSRSDREFQAFIEEAPGKKISLVTPSPTRVEPIDRVIVDENGFIVDGNRSEFPHSMTVVNIYDQEALWRQERERWAEAYQRAETSENEEQKARDLRWRRESYQSRYSSLIDRREYLEREIAQASAPIQVLVADTKVEEQESHHTAWLRSSLAQVNEEIRQLQQDALADGVVLDY